MRFSTKIGLSAAAAAVIIGPLLGATVFFAARSLLLEHIVHEQIHEASVVVESINHTLFMIYKDMHLIAADNFLRGYLDSPAEHQEQTDRVAAELKERAELTGPWDGLSVFDPSGRVVFVASMAQGNSSALADSPLIRVTFESAMKGKAYHSDLVVSPRSGRPQVIFAVPVFGHGKEVVGVLMVQNAWTPIQKILDHVDDTAMIYLFNRNGEAICKRSSDQHKERSLQFHRESREWQTLADGKEYAVQASSLHGSGTWLSVVSQLKDGGWTLLLEMPLDVMFAPIRVLARNTGLLVFGALLLMATLFAILGHRFIGPLAELVKGVRQVELDRFDQKVTVRSKDEFGELADSFNAMVEKLRTARDELLRKEKLAMLGQVAGSVGHELRNPLGVMSNAVYFLQTLLESGDETVREYLGIIRDEIDRSEHIVAELLAAVRTRTPEFASHGVAELVGQIVRQCVVPDGVTLNLELPEMLPPVRVDARQIQQVLRILISNSLEAMPEGGTLAINAHNNRQDARVRLSVRDSGSGMTPEVMARLFTPLFTTKARGIGLGLVVAKNLIEANGGTVGVESEQEEGTTVTITLPSGEDDRSLGTKPLTGKN